MPACQFSEFATNVFVCDVCRFIARTSAAPVRTCSGVPAPAPLTRPRMRARSTRPTPTPAPAAPAVKCEHRGRLLRKQTCKPCQAMGRTEIEVYQCDKLGECTLHGTSIQPRIQSCTTCPHFADRTTPRVGFVYPCWQPVGGVERHTACLIKNATGIRWSGLVALEGNLTDDKALQELSATLPAAGPDGLPQLLRDSDVLVIWGHFAELPWLKDFPGKVVAVAHGDNEWTQKQLAANLMHSDALVAVSDRARLAYPERHRERVVVIPNGIEADRLQQTELSCSVRAGLGIPPDAIVAGYVGRLSSEKNPVAAARAVGQLGGDAYALYVGNSPWHHIAEDYIAQAEAAAPGRVVWIKDADSNRIGNLYRAMDCLVVSSDTEGAPLVAGEAWWCGTPVVATPVGIVPGLEQKHGPLTWPVPLNPTAQQLAAAVREASAADCRNERVTRAQHVARTELSAETFGRRWSELLRALI